MWRRALVGLCLWLTAVSAFAAQERDSAEPATAKSESAPAKAETPLTKAERELARRLVERDEAEQSELTAAKSLEEAKGQLAEAVAADDEKAKEKAEAAVKSATEELADAKAESASAKQLAERAQEAFDLVQKEEDLRQRSAETSSEKDSAVWLESFFKRLSQAKNAREEADLAKQMAASLRKEVGLLQAQLNRVRKDSDEVQKKLSMQGGLSEELKKNLWSERQQITDESRKLSDQILATREEMLMAEATAKTKESQALNEERELGVVAANIAAHDHFCGRPVDDAGAASGRQSSSQRSAATVLPQQSAVVADRAGDRRRPGLRLRGPIPEPADTARPVGRRTGDRSARIGRQLRCVVLHQGIAAIATATGSRSAIIKERSWTSPLRTRRSCSVLRWLTPPRSAVV